MVNLSLSTFSITGFEASVSAEYSTSQTWSTPKSHLRASLTPSLSFFCP